MERRREAGGQDRPKAGKECEGGTPNAVESWCELQSAQSQGLHPLPCSEAARGEPQDRSCVVSKKFVRRTGQSGERSRATPTWTAGQRGGTCHLLRKASRQD